MAQDTLCGKFSIFSPVFAIVIMDKILQEIFIIQTVCITNNHDYKGFLC